MVGKKLHHVLLKTTVGISLAASVSLYPLSNYLVKTKTEDFDKTSMIIKGQTYSKQSFYDNLIYRRGMWYVTLSDGRCVSVDELTDFRVKDNQLYENIKNLKLVNTVDTVYVRYAHNSKKLNMSNIVYAMGTKDSLGYIPSFGSFNRGTINLRYFKADNEALQKVVDVYNDKYNCTYKHEYQHYLNLVAGSNRAGQSYENKFVECCIDEISANIAQLKEQRKNYLQNGKDLSFITSRFQFYKNALNKGIIHPQSEVLSDKEKELIANGVFDSWMKEKFHVYIKNNTSRTVWILSRTNYNGIQPDSVAHTQLMQNMLTVDGVDFSSYIINRENEIKSQIPQEQLKLFLELKKQKYKNMTYLDKLEDIKTQQGKLKYNQELVKGKFWAMLRKSFNIR